MSNKNKHIYLKIENFVNLQLKNQTQKTKESKSGFCNDFIL